MTYGYSDKLLRVSLIPYQFSGIIVANLSLGPRICLVIGPVMVPIKTHCLKLETLKKLRKTNHKKPLTAF